MVASAGCGGVRRADIVCDQYTSRAHLGFGTQRRLIEELRPARAPREVRPVFSRGHAYRFGGDEYLLLLPNMTQEWLLPFLSSLQRRIGESRFIGIESAPTVSTELVVVDADCWFTDREVLAAFRIVLPTAD
jgi:hypothetical protein